MDEINQSMRTDPKMIYGITNEFMARVSNGDEIEINKALLDFNTELIEYTKKSVQPTMILNQELNKLKLVCSDDMLPKINKYKEVTAEYLDEFQIVLNNISSKNDLDLTAKELTNISHSERTLILTKLWQEIESMMRQEIGYHKN